MSGWITFFKTTPSRLQGVFEYTRRIALALGTVLREHTPTHTLWVVSEAVGDRTVFFTYRYLTQEVGSGVRCALSPGHANEVRETIIFDYEGKREYLQYNGGRCGRDQSAMTHTRWKCTRAVYAGFDSCTCYKLL